MTLSRAKRLQAGAIATIGMPVVEALGATYHWHDEGADHFEAVIREGRQPILALWHGRILAATLYWRDRGVIAITSQNFDGEWVARLMSRFGYGSARGSTSRGGARALVELRRQLRAGSPVAFTVDGPRGPARVAQPGAAWLAGATGQPIIPFHIEASRRWTLGSWDAHQVPKPGSDIAVAVGPPIEVASTDEAVVESGRVAIEQALASLEQRTQSMLQGLNAH